MSRPPSSPGSHGEAHSVSQPSTPPSGSQRSFSDSDSESSQKHQSLKRKSPTMKGGRWTVDEEKALCKGVATYGAGKWRRILTDTDLGKQLKNRTNVDLKDKWRVILRRMDREREVLLPSGELVSIDRHVANSVGTRFGSFQMNPFAIHTGTLITSPPQFGNVISPSSNLQQASHSSASHAIAQTHPQLAQQNSLMWSQGGGLPAFASQLQQQGQMFQGMTSSPLSSQSVKPPLHPNTATPVLIHQHQPISNIQQQQQRQQQQQQSNTSPQQLQQLLQQQQTHSPMSMGVLTSSRVIQQAQPQVQSMGFSNTSPPLLTAAMTSPSLQFAINGMPYLQMTQSVVATNPPLFSPSAVKSPQQLLNQSMPQKVNSPPQPHSSIQVVSTVASTTALSSPSTAKRKAVSHDDSNTASPVDSLKRTKGDC